MKTMKIGNGEYPVIGAIKTEEYGIVPMGEYAAIEAAFASAVEQQARLIGGCA